MTRYIYRVFTEKAPDGFPVCVLADFYTEAETKVHELYPDATRIIKIRMNNPNRGTRK